MRACVGNEKEKERVGQKQTNDAHKKPEKNKQHKSTKTESREQIEVRKQRPAGDRTKEGRGAIIRGDCGESGRKAEGRRWEHRGWRMYMAQREITDT